MARGEYFCKAEFINVPHVRLKIVNLVMLMNIQIQSTILYHNITKLDCQYMRSIFEFFFVLFLRIQTVVVSLRQINVIFIADL